MTSWRWWRARFYLALFQWIEQRVVNRIHRVEKRLADNRGKRCISRMMGLQNSALGDAAMTILEQMIASDERALNEAETKLHEVRGYITQAKKWMVLHE